MQHKIHPEDVFKIAVNNFINETGMKPTAFGRTAASDATLLARIQTDSITKRMAKRVWAFMASYKQNPTSPTLAASEGKAERTKRACSASAGGRHCVNAKARNPLKSKKRGGK